MKAKTEVKTAMIELPWKRIELGPGNPGIGDAAAQLFEGRRQMRLEIFVREDLQNRVDARKDESGPPVRVRISLQTLPAKLIRKYFPDHFQDWYRRTETHLLKGEDATRREAEIDALFESAEFPVLVIEDFESTGLNGPINSKIPVKDESDPLYHSTNSLTCFLRVNGRSGKTGKQLGSAGFGRLVYYKASQISSKFVYTVPVDLSRKESGALTPLEPRPLFFGQAFLRELVEQEGDQERSYCSYYYLTGEDDSQGLPMPLGIRDSEAKVVEQARKDFRLSRKPSEPGCSIVIPFPRSNFSSDALINSIVRDFPMPVLAGGLDIEVDGQRITAANVASLADKAEVNSHNAFLRDAINAEADETVKVDQERLKQPLGADLLSDAQLKSLAVCYRDRDLVTLKVEIEYGSRPEQSGTIMISVRKTADGEKGRHIVARSGLVLSDYSDLNFTRASNAIIRVQRDELGTLLRSVENPAHTEWLPGDVDPYKCSCPNELIQFVKGAHSAFDRILVNLDTEDDLDVFSDLLPSGGRKPPEETKESPFEVVLASETFSLSPAESYEADPGARWRLSVVYDSSFGSGRARKGYRPGTYDLHSVPVTVKGGTVDERGDCHLDVTVSAPKAFSLDIGPCQFADWADIRFHAELFGTTGGEET